MRSALGSDAKNPPGDEIIVSRADATASRVCVSAQDSRTATRLVFFGPGPARPGTAPASASPDATDQGFFRFLSSGVGEPRSLWTRQDDTRRKRGKDV